MIVLTARCSIWNMNVLYQYTFNLLNQGHQVVALDNFCNSKALVLERIQEIANKELVFIEGDIRDAQLLKDLFSKRNPGMARRKFLAT